MFRKDYTKCLLSREDLKADPFAQFRKWYEEAVEAIEEPDAMQLATATKEGKPSCRTVLMKQYDARGFVFFTNYDSRKGRELEENPHAFGLFAWKELERQVSIEGQVEKIAREESEKYFSSRPRGAQLSAWASKQGQVLAERKELVSAYEFAEMQYTGKAVPLPPNWGGYRLIPARFEFWQGRSNRLHDRFSYRKEGSNWVIERLSP